MRKSKIVVKVVVFMMVMGMMTVSAQAATVEDFSGYVLGLNYRDKLADTLSTMVELEDPDSYTDALLDMLNALPSDMGIKSNTLDDLVDIFKDMEDTYSSSKMEELIEYIRSGDSEEDFNKLLESETTGYNKLSDDLSLYDDVVETDVSNAFDGEVLYALTSLKGTDDLATAFLQLDKALKIYDKTNEFLIYNDDGTLEVDEDEIDDFAQIINSVLVDNVSVTSDTIDELKEALEEFTAYFNDASEDDQDAIYANLLSDTLEAESETETTSTGATNNSASTIVSTTEVTEEVVPEEATPESSEIPLFDDVDSSDWYYDAVQYIAGKGILADMTENAEFDPTDSATRADFLVMVMRALGVTPDNYSDSSLDTMEESNFSDAGDSYYTDYLAIAKSEDIVNGIGDNMFDPEATITRQEVFTMMYNIMDEEGLVGDSTADLTDYSDADEIADWAMDAMKYFVATGVVEGDDGSLMPTDNITRAEVAQLIYNLMVE